MEGDVIPLSNSPTLEMRQKLMWFLMTLTHEIILTSLFERWIFINYKLCHVFQAGAVTCGIRANINWKFAKLSVT